MFKKSAFLLGALLVMIVLVACHREVALYNEDSNSALQNYLNEHRVYLLSAFDASLQDDVSIASNDENELIFTFDLTQEEYQMTDEFAQSVGIEGVTELLYRTLYDDIGLRAIVMADEIHNELELDMVKITIIYTVEGSELLRESFTSGNFD